jgi:DNA-directed RNA polymerase subunit beta'
VDYSGRSVIVVGPELRLHQCGLPKKMALELFKPFVFNKLEEGGHSTTIKQAKKLVEKEIKEVWDALDEVIRQHPVLLNRAPTLHRLGMQAFEPVLIVHVPLSIEAQSESRVLMMSTNNILSPAHGKPVIGPTQDIVLGIYYLTRDRIGAKGEGKIFSNLDEVRIAYDSKEIDIHALIKARMNGKLVETTVGRVILFGILPEDVPFEMVNKVMKKKDLGDLIDYAFRHCGQKATVILSDRLKKLGFQYATYSGISISVDDSVIREYTEGLITDGERYNKVVDIWSGVAEEVAAEMMKEMATETVKDRSGKDVKIQSFNPIYMMAESGARGSDKQMRQLAGMRGLMAKPTGEIIETPITSNFREGLSVLQYFISTHGARKGLADTALKTANAGYLTRRLVDVAQDGMIAEEDCQTLEGVEMRALIEGGEIIDTLSDRLLGRVALEDIIDPVTEEVIIEANEEITEEKARRIQDSGIDSVLIRSVITCQLKKGICARCYGRDLARGNMISMGEAIGIMAAQSIGEPGTQLTMRTFHIGGAASRSVEQSFLENKNPGVVKFSNLHTVEKSDGTLVAMTRNGEIVIIDEAGREREKYPITYGATIFVRDEQKIKANTRLGEWDPYNIPIRAGR